MKLIKPFLFWLIVFLSLSSLAFAQDALLTWDANTEEDLLGYRIYIGETPYMSVPYENPEGLGSITTANTELPLFKAEHANMYIWATAVDFSLNESGNSEFLVYRVGPNMPTGVELYTMLMIPINGGKVNEEDSITSGAVTRGHNGIYGGIS